jgi:hypothetical protein
VGGRAWNFFYFFHFAKLYDRFKIYQN